MYYVDEDSDSILQRNIFVLLLIKKLVFVFASVVFKNQAFSQIITCFSL